MSWLRLCLVLAACLLPRAATSSSPLYDQNVLVVDPGMHTSIISSVAVDATGRLAVTGSFDKTVRVWSAADGKLLRTICLPAGPGNIGKVYAVAISPDGALIAAGGWTRWTAADPQEQIYLFDSQTGAMIRRIGNLPGVTTHLAFSKDGGFLAVTFASGGLSVFSRGQDWGEALRDTDYSDDAYGADFAADGRLATTALDGQVRLYGGDFRLQAKIRTLHNGRPVSVSFSPDGRFLAVGYVDSTNVSILDARTLAPSEELGNSGIDNGDLSQVAWSRDGRTLFAGGSYGSTAGVSILAWAVGGSSARRTLNVGRETVKGLASLPDGDVLVVDQGPRIARFDAGGAVRWQYPTPNADFRDGRLSVSSDGTKVDFNSAGSGQGTARFDLGTHALTLNPPSDGQTSGPRVTGLPITDWRNTSHPKAHGALLVFG